MAYKILGNDTLTALETQVNEYRKKGFEPCGSIFTHDDNRCGRCVFQPMLKRNFLSWFFNRIIFWIKNRGKE